MIAILGALPLGCAVHGEPAPAHLVAAVERVRGERFRETPRIVRVDRVTLRAEAEQALETLLPPAIARGEGRVLAALGLVPEGHDLRAGARGLLSDRLAALYDPARAAIVVPAGETPSDQVLLHELVHALQDQRFGLYELATGRHGPRFDHQLSDEGLALECLREGEAVLVAARASGRALDLPRLAGRPLTDAPHDLPPWLRVQLRAPYERGPVFVAQLLERGGWKAVDRAFAARRPDTTAQVLHPQRVHDRRSRQLDAPPAWVQERRLAGALTVGELGLQALFEVLDANPHADACAGWLDDVARVYDDGSRPVLVWQLLWRTEADARAFHQALAPLRRQGPRLLANSELTRHDRDVLLIGGAPPAECARLRARLLR